MYKIRGFDDEITLKTSEIYYQIIKYIFSYFDGIRRQFDSMVDKIEENKKDVNYDDLVKCVTILRGCNWVLKKLQTLLPSITNDINKLAHVIQSSVIDSLNKIGKMCSLPKNNKKNRAEEKEEKKSDKREVGFATRLNAKNTSSVLEFLKKCTKIPCINTPNVNESNDNCNESKEKEKEKESGRKGIGTNDGSINRLVVNSQINTSRRIYISI